MIPLAFAFALCGLSMCRLAALSDHAQLSALAEWIATSCPNDSEATPAERPYGRGAAESIGDDYRATG